MLSTSSEDEYFLQPLHCTGLDSVQNRRRAILIDGTWCAHEPSQNTMIGTLGGLMTKEDEIQEVKYYSGIGTYSSLADRFVGGATGWGIKRRLFEIFVDLVKSYRKGDELVIIGYSRGAFMAQTLAKLLDCVGIPRNYIGSAHQLKRSFELFWINKLFDSNERRKFKARADSLDVPIQFLGCFDTVGSLGVPKTGLLTPLKYTPRLIRHLQFRSTNLPKNVRVFRHALGLDEYRKIFEPTLMHIDVDSLQDVMQTWFSGSHYNMGVVSPDGRGLGNVVLRWMIEELSNVGVLFDEIRFLEHFPRYTIYPAELVQDNAQEWVVARVYPTWTQFWKTGGMKKRVPGWYGRAEKKTNEFIHPTVHYREAFKARHPYEHRSLEGHTRQAALDGGFVWKKNGSWSSHGSWFSDNSRCSRGLDMDMIPEAAHGPLQGHLGGYSVG